MITSLRLQNFRSYKDTAFEFEDGVNIIVGPNASGKTNALEAIMVVSTGESYRARDAELMRFNTQWLRLDAQTSSEQRTLKIEEPRASKTFEVGGKTYKRLPFDKTFPVVLFEPEHLRLLGGQPELRRDYLDNLLTQTTPGYKQLRQQYQRTLRQRNALLKRGQAIASGQIFAWDIRLSELGGQIAIHRGDLVETIHSDVARLYQKLSNSKVKLVLNYQSAFAIDHYSSRLLHALEQKLRDDCARGFTGTGPHRDDLTILFDGHPAQDSASRGEVRTLLLALKVIELQLLEKVRGQKPLLLLDDVFSELDGTRRRALTAFLQDYQTFITTTDADVVVKHFIGNCNIIPTTK